MSGNKKLKELFMSKEDILQLRDKIKDFYNDGCNQHWLEISYLVKGVTFDTSGQYPTIKEYKGLLEDCKFRNSTLATSILKFLNDRSENELIKIQEYLK
jgi:hypothetical protein